MKAKTIKSVLRNKIKAWLASIDDEHVRKLAEENTIVTGGSIASMLLREPVNDYDIYFRTREACVAVALYYVRKFKENPPTKFKGTGDQTVEIFVADGYCRPIDGRHEVTDEKSGRVRVVVKSAGIASENGAGDYQYFEGVTNPNSTEAEDYVNVAVQAAEENKDAKDKPEYRPVFLTANAISLSGDIQIVTRFYGEPDVIHENYDFVHCTNYWCSWDGNLVLRQEALESLLARELRYVGSKYPLCSIIRTRKFIKRDWTINAGQYLKMAMQLGDLDLNKVEVLEDQLTGVDAAYFMEVIRAIKEKNETTVDRAYLLQIIDRIF